MYIADVSKLKPGDILLTRQQQIVSKTIRAATYSGYSHAVFYLGNSMYIHSVGDGVQADSLQRWLFEELGDLKVLRLVVENQEAVSMAAKYVRQMAGTQYSVKEALKTRRSANKKIEKANRQFCSRLVAEAFSVSGVDIVESPSFCSPADIENSELLVEVDSVLRRALPVEIEFSKSESFIDADADLLNKLFAKIRLLTGSDIQNFKQLIDFLVDNSNFDGMVTEAMIDSGYFDMWRSAIENSPWALDVSAFLKLPMSNSDKIKLAKWQRDTSEELIDRYFKLSEHYFEMYKLMPLEFFRLHIDVYKNLMDMHEQRRRTAEYILNI